MNPKIFVIVTFAFLTFSCHNNHSVSFKNGLWKGEMVVSGEKAPFLFEVHNTGTDSVTVILINGDERIKLTGTKVQGDSVMIPVEAFDAVIKARLTQNSLDGLFLKNYISNDKGIQITAMWGNYSRFDPVASPVNISPEGKWDVLFVSEKGDTTKNIGVFRQNANTVVGTILTNSGDLRFLEGILTEDGFHLSAFSGLSPYLFKMRFEGNDRFTGTFYTSRGKTALIGTRNESAELEDPYSLTFLKDGAETIDFTFPNIAGNPISLSDERFSGKVVIISILGSWCPNCLDEMNFLSPWYSENKSRGVEIIGLAFERKSEPEYIKKTLKSLVKRYNVEYEILFAGTTSEESKQKALPALNKLSSFPTTIFIDKKGKVRKIHTGFNGPATGEYFDEFKKEFNSSIYELLAE